jgi:hypothetical protein
MPEGQTPGVQGLDDDRIVSDGTLCRHESPRPGSVCASSDRDVSAVATLSPGFPSKRSRQLDVPYFAQPTGITCQSTVLKMFAAYLEQVVLLQSTGAAERAITDIWKDLNEDSKRPVKARNAHANMKWWLERRFRFRFEYTQTQDEARAVEDIVGFVDGGFPVLMSVSHARVAGHIILVIGYSNYTPGMSSTDFELIVHDPYGAFDPTLLSRLFGTRRWVGGSSLIGGGESGPGRANRLPIHAVSRRRAGDSRAGIYYLLSASR